MEETTMGKLSVASRKGKRKNLNYLTPKDVREGRFEGLEGPIDSQHTLLSLLIPPAIKMFLEDLEKEIIQM